MVLFVINHTKIVHNVMRKAQDSGHHTKLRQASAHHTNHTRIVHNILNKLRMLQAHQKRIIHNIADKLMTVHTMSYNTRMVHTIPDDLRMV